MKPIADYLVTDRSQLTPMEALRASPDALLGVSADAADALKDLTIPTVFDLAASRIFANAALLYEAATDPRSMLARFGMAPADVLDALPPGVALDQLRNQPISILEGIGAASAAKLSKALSVSTVRDLALWPPYLAARAIVATVFYPDQVPGGDADAPADLLPKSGEFPTERVFYSTLVLDGFDGDPGQLTPLNGPVAVNPVVDDAFGFTKPGIGALLTMAQSWYAQGVALGQLLHSVALAPGESTRIAMIDWSRRSIGKQDEAVSETESLSNVTEHSRALSEVTSAVAQEAQSGFSETEAQAFSQQSGSAAGIGLGPLTIGESGGSAQSISHAKSFSSSSGRRDLSAAMTQNVVDRTQQHANAARNRRATVVKEISQTEREQVSSRVVTNYNHMHALSVQYYEVVQIYRVSVALTRIEKCLFIPMALIDFRNPALVRQFKDVLRGAAIDPDAAALLGTDLDTVVVKNPAGSVLVLNNPFGARGEVRDGGKTLALSDEARLTGFNVIRSRGGINDLVKLSDITVQLRDGTKAELQEGAPLSSTHDTYKVIDRPALREISTISMTNPTSRSDNEYSLTFMLNNKGQSLWFTGTLLITPGVPVTALTFSGGGVWQNLVDHLTANRLHYSQAVFRSLDPATVTLLLANYSYKGKPVTVQIDPQPLTTAGNYLVFKTHVNPNEEDDEGMAWQQWLDDHGVSFKEVKEDLVPLPSGGVFAEAVLGRYNSAEKLDITRFWNWQDSPIPIVAPEIAPLQLGSRATEEDLKAQPFSPSMLNIVNPTSLPDPVGMAGVLQAIQNGNMFRDMSGLAATIGLAQAGIQTTSDAATAASVQAGSNMATAAKKEVEMFKAALAFAGAMMGKGTPDTSPSTISNEGAKINQGRSMDQRGVAPTGGGNGGSTVAIPTRGISGGGNSSGGNGGGAQAPTTNGGSNEGIAFQRALWGSQGESQGSAQRAMLNFAFDAGETEGGTALDAGGGGAGTSGQKRTLPPVPPRGPFPFPPVDSMPGPAQHPQLMTSCPSGVFFGDPPTRNQSTSGTVLSASEVIQRQNDIIKAISIAKAQRPMSAAHLQHWLDGTGSEFVMNSAPFKKVDSGVPSFLAGMVRDKFEAGCRDRLRNKTHSQGTLLPTTLNPGAKGPVRFIQWRDGLRSSAVDTPDLFTAVGSFNVHSAAWVQATFIKHDGGLPVIGGGDDVFEVEILRWCVQIYDVYDWNLVAQTPFPVPDADVGKLPLPPGAVTIRSVGAGMSVVLLKDSYFRDLEVSGIGRAFLLRTEPFEAPSSAMGKFTIKI